MVTMSGIYDGETVVLNEKCGLTRKCDVVVVFSESHKNVKQNVSPLDSLLNKINDANIHAEIDFGIREGCEIW